MPTSASERTLLDDMMAEAVKANKEKDAAKRKEAAEAATKFGAGLSGGFFGAGGSQPVSAAAAPAVAPAPAPAKRCDNPSCGKHERDVKAAGGKFAKCGRCKAVWYCCTECQKQHWSSGHKSHCGKVCVYCVGAAVAVAVTGAPLALRLQAGEVIEVKRDPTAATKAASPLVIPEVQQAMAQGAAGMAEKLSDGSTHTCCAARTELCL